MTTFLYSYDANNTGVVEERLNAIMAQQKLGQILYVLYTEPLRPITIGGNHIVFCNISTHEDLFNTLNIISPTDTVFIHKSDSITYTNTMRSPWVEVAAWCTRFKGAVHLLCRRISCPGHDFKIVLPQHLVYHADVVFSHNTDQWGNDQWSITKCKNASILENPDCTKPALEAACRGEVFKYEKPAKYFLYAYQPSMSASLFKEIVEDRLHAIFDSLEGPEQLYVISRHDIREAFFRPTDNVSWRVVESTSGVTETIEKLPENATVCIITEDIAVCGESILEFWYTLYQTMSHKQTLHLVMPRAITMVEHSPVSFFYGSHGWTMTGNRYGSTARTIREVREALELAAQGRTCGFTFSNCTVTIKE